MGKKIKKILITGALGQIGSGLIRSVSDVATEVTTLDNLESRRYPSLFDLPKGVKFKFIRDDVAKADFDKLLSGVDLLIHLANTNFYENNQKAQKGVEKNNLQNLKRVANACLEAGLRIKFNSQTDWVGSTHEIIGSNVIDSAHQLQKGQYKDYKGKKLCFSFYPTKTIGSAEGGAIATDDSEFANWVRSISTYGRDQKPHQGNSWDYEVQIVGYKRHYTNLQAAICLEQLRRLDQTNAKRQRIVSIYNQALGYNNQSDYLYRINIPGRDKFIQYALENGVECGVHFKPLHLMTLFKNIPISKKDKINVEKAYEMTVSLPFYDTMTDSEINKVIEVVKKYDYEKVGKSTKLYTFC